MLVSIYIDSSFPHAIGFGQFRKENINHKLKGEKRREREEKARFFQMHALIADSERRTWNYKRRLMNDEEKQKERHDASDILVKIVHSPSAREIEEKEHQIPCGLNPEEKHSGPRTEQDMTRQTTQNFIFHAACKCRMPKKGEIFLTRESACKGTFYRSKGESTL